MTRRRFIADQVSGDRAVLLGDHADHLGRVLRAHIGQEFDVATGATVRRGKISSVEAARVEFDLGEEVSGGSLMAITLALAVFKFDRLEWAIEKCTELGVARIIPVIARRTDAHLAAASAKRTERWQRIARQAAEQSRRSAPPEIAMPIKLAEILDLQAGLRIVLAESEEQILLADVVRAGVPNDSIILAIGPEGGWTEEELRSFQQARWISASLGSTILRSETAAIAATAVVASVLHSL